jgi:hypothetical protein
LDTGNSYVFVSDVNNSSIRRITYPAAVVTTLSTTGFSQNPGTKATFSGSGKPVGLVFDGTSTIYYAASNAYGKVTTGGVNTALVTGLTYAYGIAFNSNKTGVYIVDVVANAVLSAPLVAGSATIIAGASGTGAVDATGTAATFNSPRFPALDAAGSNLYIPDLNSAKIRKLNIATCNVTTYAGTGVAGFADGSVPTTTVVNNSLGINCNAPAYALDVTGSIQAYTSGNTVIMARSTNPTSTNVLQMYKNGSSGGLYQYDNGSMYLTTNGSTVSGITIYGSNSYVGIGCNAPSYALDVNGNARVTSNGSLSTANSQYGAGYDSLTIQSTVAPYSGGIASLAFTNTAEPLGRIYCQDAQPTGGAAYLSRMVFQTNASGGGLALIERMRIDANGYVGINCNAPSYTLDVSGTSHFTGIMSINTTSNSDNLNVYGSINVFNNNTNGGVITLCNTSLSPGSTYFSMHSNTNFYCVNSSNGPYVAKGGTSWTTGSDSRMKTVLSTVSNATEMLSTITPVYFTYNADPDKKQRIGVIAQNVLPVFPELVVTNPDPAEMLGVDYTNFAGPLIAAVKELSARLSNVEAKLAATTTA